MVSIEFRRFVVHSGDQAVKYDDTSVHTDRNERTYVGYRERQGKRKRATRRNVATEVAELSTND